MPNARSLGRSSKSVRSLPHVALITRSFPMRQFFRPTLIALSIAFLAASFGSLSLHPALAQIGDPSKLKQITLTQQQIDNVLASA